MLSGEGKAGERWKTTIGLISNVARAAHFFVHFFAVVLNCTTTTWNFQKRLRACLHGGVGPQNWPQIGEVTCGGSSHLSCKRDQDKMRDYMDRRITPPKQVTPTTWGLPPPCKQALSYTFSGGNIVRFLVHLFFTAAHFHLAFMWPLAVLILSPLLQNFHVVLPTTKKCLLCFLSLALDFCRPFSRWASLACRLLSLFLCLSLALYSKFVDMTINLSLIL